VLSIRTVAVSVAAVGLVAGTATAATAATTHTSPTAVTHRAAAGFGVHATGYTFAGGNWGGYAATGSYTTASASWTLPATTCTSTNDLYAAWVGLDGYGSSTVEQTGVAADCSSGSLRWRPWYEMYPRSPVYFTGVTTRTGDSISATVTSLGGGKYRLVISDSTSGWSKTFNQSLSSARNASAEAVVESPTDSYPRFASQPFTSVTFNGRALSSTGPTRLTADNRGTGSVVASAITNGEDFSMTEN
jgi:hypothetical protein